MPFSLETGRQRQEILVPFLNERQKEVRDIMRTLFDQETILEIERYNLRQEVRLEEFARIVRSMRKKGLDSVEIASLLERDIADVEAVK